MSVNGVLDEALRDGIYLYVDDSKLKYVAAKNSLSLELKRKLEAFKEEIIDRLARDAAPSEEFSSLLTDIPPLDRETAGPFSLSFGQRRLWFLHQYMGPNAVYNVPLALRLHGEVNEAALVRSLKEVYRRHESLRTRFEAQDGNIVQVICPPGLELEVEAASAAEAQAIAHAERFYLFDLSSERLCRIRLLRETGSEGNAGDYVLLVTMHHGVSDAWSLGIFFRELLTLYRVYANGEDSPLAPLPIQYADYAQWQRRWLQGAVVEKQLSYWRRQLEGLPPLLTLPTDRPRPAEQTFRGSTERFALPVALSERLQALSREHGVTLFMTLLSGWAVLLGRYSGQQEVAIGTPVASRTRQETEGLIGFFVNMLVMREDLRGDPRFVDLLKQTREVALQAYGHQDIPFEQLVEELNPGRSLSHSPLFQVAFGLVNTPFETVELPGFAVLPLREDVGEDQEGTARFDMTLNVQESATGLVGALEYNTDLFEGGTIRRMLEHYARLLEAIVTAPQSRLSRLGILSEEERHRQVVEWNASARDFPRNKSVHELFDEQADRSPEAIAIIDEDRQLTYREVNERANGLANCLIEQGVAPGSTVGLCVDRGVERLVGLLGILKAGSAYVPLNHDDPVERLGYLLEDSDVELIVTQPSVRPNEESFGRRWMELGAEGALPGYPGTNPGVAVRASALACVRYEADGAGVPVGRMIPHTGLLERAMTGGQEFSGGWIESLLTWPMDWSASVARQATAQGAAHHVLDRHGELLPVGAVGELYVGGDAPGWGYLHRSGVTAERFVPDALSTMPGGRLYRTGESARWTADGRLELVDQEPTSRRSPEEERLAIERALRGHEAVREATVLARESAQGERRLVAYVVERASSSAPAQRFIAQLQAHLRTQSTFCPVPHEWMVLESLPRTAEGAVDRSGLPQPEGFAEKLTYMAPRTPLENRLVELWQEQLGIERVGVEDNYFALGGDSIRSLALVAQARQRGVRFSVKDLFANPTVSGLASALERGDVRCAVDVEQEIEPFALLSKVECERLSQRHDMEAVEDAFPLSMMQQGMVVESLRHLHLGVYLNFQIYEFKDPWDRALFERALRHLMAKHPMLRTIHDFSGERPLQLVLKERAPDLKVVDVRDLDKAAIQSALGQWMQGEQSIGLDTTKSLWRAAVHISPGEQFLFGMHLHHALWDGWSLESFATELYATYGLLKREGRVAEYRPLPSYRHFVALEQSALSSQAYRAYWTQKLEGATVPWWTGREKSASTFMACDISQETSDRLAGLARTLGVQEKSVWCSVYLALLSLLSGTDEGLGTVMTQGRPEIPGGEKIIGVFLNALPTRVRMSGRRWVELITATDRELREQHACRQYPLAEIQRLTGLDFSAAMFGYVSWHVYYEGVDREGTPDEWIPQKLGGWHDTNYLLNFMVRKDDRSQRFELGIGADSGVFDAAFRERIRGYASRIVDAIAGDATAVIEKTKLLGDEECQQQLVEWNATARVYPDDKCIHELFEEQVRQRYDGVALVHEGSVLTYGELNRRANGLAHRLIERGVGPEVRVGLCTQLSAERVIGILGILKAGGCYVPLDPSDPPLRLAYLIQDSGMELIVSDLAVDRSLDLESLAGEEGRIECVSLDGGGTKATSANPNTRVTAENSAYAIYTAVGGEPRGVLGTHRSVNNLATCQSRRCGMDRGSRVLHVSSVGFDAANWDWSMALLSGSALHLVPEETAKSADRLSSFVKSHRINYSSISPAALKLLRPSDFGSVDVMTVDGARASIDTLREWSVGRRLLRTYGPAENTGISATGESEASAAFVGIGKPIENVSAYVLGPDGELLPEGVAGELHLGGVGLSRGYLNRPGLTAERFIPHRFSDEPGERLYRTGDLARWLAGTLEFVGRADHQVKVRGLRIETGEIERVLLAHEAVREAVVVAHEEDSGSKRLVGYIVAGASTQEDDVALVNALRSRLQEQLPIYMVPSAFVVLSSLPLTANGEVDREALPAPVEPASESAYAAPEGVTEQLLAELWGTVLERERVGRHDSFFALGGHSLLATQLSSRIREAFSTELPVRELFEHPTLSSQARAVERARGAGALIDIPVEVVSRDEPLPLSYAQQRLWFLHKYMGPNAVYNMPLALRLHGEVNEATLVRSLEELHRRHESLRTRFETRDDSTVQVIDPPGLELEVEAVSAAEAQAIAHSERFYCFDLSSEQLCRIRLLRETRSHRGAAARGDAGDYVLLVTMHHSVSDGWSLGIFFRELVSLYRAYANGESSPLAPLPIQYADYAQWQRGWLQGAVLEKQLSYWRQQLAGLPPLLTLPTDRPRPAEQTFCGSMERFALPVVLAEKLQALSREQGVTMYMTLLAAWAVLLGRYSGQQDVAVGTPIANRTRRETEGLIGFFANTLVMRHDLSGDPRFVELLKRTREVALQGYAHQDIPFEQLVEALNPQRSVSHSPLFQVMFVLQNAPLEALQLPRLEVQPLLDGKAAEEGEEDAPEGTARFDLTLGVQETPAGLVGALEYNTDLFDRNTIRRMLDHYSRLLEAIVDAPVSPLSQLQMLGDEERRQQLVEWNATSRAYPQEKCIHELFEEQARQRPDAVAVVHEGRELSYGELNRRANQLAHRLIERGVGPEVRVGLCLPRSAQMVIGILGILKAGAAYVPLDPGYPRKRLEYLLEDSAVQLLVSERAVEESLELGSVGAGAGRTYIRVSVDAQAEGIGQGRTDNPLTAVNPANLAYVIYTSGSTGRPKGVGIAHRSAVSLLSWSAEQWAEPERAGVLASTSMCFDLSIYELFVPLTQGGECLLIDSILGLGEMAERERVSLINTVPSAAKALLEKGGLPRSLRVMNLAGEPLKAELVDALYASSAACGVYDLYGPSESTTYSTYALRGAKGRETIGRPVANTQAYVVDGEGELLPSGVVGELYLGGVGLARGYLNRPGPTAEKFIPHRFSAEAGERLYRTGDLARWLPDGTLEFLGRMDHQVKVRGYRIELGEIESVLRAHEAVRDAVVVAREEAGSKRLVGYVVAEAGAQADEVALIQELRGRLQEQLPGYMAPSALMVLECLPLTANGKLDRKALPAPDFAGVQTEFVAPRNEMERSLCSYWQDLLKIESIGIHHNFWELGGHSLLALRVCNFVRQEFGVELKLSKLFANPSVAQLAEHISLELDARNLSSKRLICEVAEDVEEGSF